MARKHVIYDFQPFVAVSATTSQTSVETNVSQLDELSVHLKFSASNSGTFTVEARNGKDSDWYELDFGAPLSITAESEVQILLRELPFTDVRFKWAPSAGSGTLSARLTAKTLGA